MAKCPKCKTENPNPTKTWKYGLFTVNARARRYEKGGYCKKTKRKCEAQNCPQILKEE
ncbi:MAG: hypothetical protein ACPLKQ_08710 [Candidatus Bathyarchaeales archaeon]